MKMLGTILLSAIFFLSEASAQKGLSQFFSNADKFLKSYTSEGNVYYAKVRKDFATIDRLYKEIGDVSLTSASDSEKMAFYINAYNLIVIHEIAKYYPLKSAIDKSGFFDKVRHKVAGESLTLDKIEKGKVVLVYGDPRVHFAFSCAAQGCPKLASFAFTADKLEDQLNERTKYSVNNEYFIRVMDDKSKVYISKIFAWYKRDFDKVAGSAISFINKFRDSKIPQSYMVDFYEYDWALNSVD